MAVKRRMVKDVSSFPGAFFARLPWFWLFLIWMGQFFIPFGLGLSPFHQGERYFHGQCNGGRPRNISDDRVAEVIKRMTQTCDAHDWDSAKQKNPPKPMGSSTVRAYFEVFLNSGFCLPTNSFGGVVVMHFTVVVFHLAPGPHSVTFTEIFLVAPLLKVSLRGNWPSFRGAFRPSNITCRPPGCRTLENLPRRQWISLRASS